MNFDKVKDQLGEGWATKFRPFIESEEFDKIFAFIKSESREGKTICPASQDLFRAFKECPYEDLKCIFILQDPYPRKKKGVFVADGIAMSCSHTGELQPSLELFYEGMEEDLGTRIMRIPDLTYLANQGILFLNASLTVELDKPGSHSKKGIWDTFMNFLIHEVINFYNRGLIYVSLGTDAQIITKAVIPFLHWGFELEHPAFAARSERKWKHQNVFTNINKLLKDSNSDRIIWNYRELKL